MDKNFEHIIIIPCYNESNRINLALFEIFLKSNPNYLLIFANDGSLDKTSQKVLPLQTKYSNCEIFDFPKNEGKANTIRKSVLLCCDKYRYKTIGYMDADLSVDLEEYIKISKIVDSKKLFSFGSRIKKVDSQIERSFSRHLFGRIISTINSLLFKLDVYDTQCGCKSFSHKVAKDLFSDNFVSKWMFDLEIFLRLRNLDYDLKINCAEVPLKKWIEMDDSRISWTYSIKIWIDIYLIYKKNNGKRLLRKV